MGSTQPRRIEERIARELGQALLLLAVALVQVALIPTPLGFSPALVLVLVLCRTLVSGPGEGVRWAFYGGLALDVCTTAPIGSHAIAILLAVFVVHLCLRRIRIEHWLMPIAAAFIGALIYESLLALIYTHAVAPLTWTVYASVVLIPSALLAMLPALPLYMVLHRIALWNTLQEI